MRRFFQDTEPDGAGRLVLEGAEANHAARVIRLRPGESAMVLDGRGTQYICRAIEVDRRQVVLQVEQQTVALPDEPRIIVYPSLIKGKAFEHVIQKMVELGVGAIVPVMTDRAVARLEASSAAGKLEKWKQTALEAIKQCGAAWLPEITQPMSLEQALEFDQSTEFRVVASLETDATILRFWLDRFMGDEGRLPVSVSLWIGPEGDFTSEEYRALRESGIAAVTLGPRVLRSETAVVSALSVLNYELNCRR